MKKYLTLLLLATAFYSALSQSNHVQVDSLIQHLNDSMADTNRMKIYEQIATKMWTKDTVLSLQYVDSMLLLAKATNDVAAMGRSYLVRGTVYSNFNQYNKAIVLFKEALIFFEQVDDPQYLGTTYNRMGNNFYYQGMISNALAVYIKAQPFFELAGTKKRAAQNLNNIAIMYRSQEQYQKAIEIYEMSLKIKREVEDSIGIANTYFNIGLAYGFMKKGDFAIANLEKAKQIYKSLNAEKDIASIDLALGIQLIKQQSYEEGIFIIEQSLSRNRALFSSGDILNSYKYLGEAYLALKNYTRAIQYLGEGYDIIRETGNQGLKLEFYSYLSRAHAGQEDYRKAFLFSEQRNTLNDTLYQISKAEAEEEMETRFETKLKENKIALQEAKIQEAQNRSRLYLIISCLLGLFVIAAIIFTYFLRRSRKELAEKNKLISKSLEEKEMLLKEIHHRVKNNLQVISSLLNLQSQTVKDASAQSAIIEGRNRVKSMALIHQNLYQEQDMRGVDAAEYVTKLTENLFDSYQVDHENIRFQHRVSPLTLDVDTVIPIGLILNELISNALKYAFPEGRPGILEVRLEESQEGLKLSVLDDGVGVEPEVFNHQSNSMGYRIIRAFVKKLKAIMTVNHENGTRIDILIPQ